MSNVEQRSTFVTVVAWIFIVLSAFGAIIGILQNIMVQALFRSGELNQAMQASPSQPGLPPMATFMFENFQWFFLGALLVNLFSLTISIGLLKRWNWARLCFIGLMVLGVVWQFVGLGIQASIFSSIHEQFSTASLHGAPDIGPFFIVIGAVSVIFALAFGALFGWIAWKLMSKPIAAEFQR